MSDRETIINVQSGTNIHVENRNGAGKIRIYVVDNNNNGDCGYRDVPAGSTVRDVVGDASGHISHNGRAANPDDTVEQDDKVTVTPQNVDGN